MYNLFFHPKEKIGAAADFIPFFDNDTFHLFYLYDHRNIEKYGEGVTWYKIESKDFTSFVDKGQMIVRGNNTDLDLYAFTGCVFKSDNVYHMFYTGHNPYIKTFGNQNECIMHAQSCDLDNWTKLPQDTFYAPNGYDHCDFRDPFVYLDETSKLYCMLLCARTVGGNNLRRGQTIKMISTDLSKWEFDSVVYAPNSFHTHECPDLFQMGKWWYLIFSEYSDRSVTCYRMAKTPNGPWIKPINDSFDGRAFYAAKTASSGNDRYIFGWVPTRQQNKDNGDWMWGGNLAVHQLLQNADGTLSVKMPQSIDDYFTTTLVQTSQLEITSPRETKVVKIYDKPINTYKLSFCAKPSRRSDKFGVLVNYNDITDNAYSFIFDLSQNTVSVNRFPCFPQNQLSVYQLTRPLKKANVYNVKLLADNDIFVIYVNDDIALSVRLYDLPRANIALYASNSQTLFENVTLKTLK